MGENRSEILVSTQTVQLKNTEIAQAKRKRMMLAEVYVHKSRKLDTEASKDDHFDVFHIYEFDDNDLNTKITPKLSTNCTEPRKIIEVLQNSTGSETPQLQRLIEKLCAQNKKWTENQNQNQNNKYTTSNAANATNVTNGSKTIPAQSNAQIQSASCPTGTIPVTIAASSNAPVIRVKAIESMKANQENTTNSSKDVTNFSRTINPSTPAPKVNQSAPVQRVILPTLRPSAVVSVKNGIESEKQPDAGNKQPTSNNPIKLWNNVMQKNNTEKDLEYLVVANTEDASIDKSVFCLKPTNTMVEHATENSSVLKIDQVYECVSDEFVEDLLVEKRPTPSVSPLLDNLIRKQKVMQTRKPSAPINFIPPSNDKCSDFRCNICLEFNDSYGQYKSHMSREHQYTFICENCHDVFRTRQLFDLHLNPRTMRCDCPENSKRTFICIVDPPVILMKNNRVFAFRCKHCSVAFQNQRNYVQHAQRHAKQFRCKLCPSAKPMTSTAMQAHLNQH